jgi:hypothetical protein
MPELGQEYLFDTHYSSLLTNGVATEQHAARATGSAWIKHNHS